MKKSHQVKSRFYYIFWVEPRYWICTLQLSSRDYYEQATCCLCCVVLGQLYVGAGYRFMAGSVNNLTYSFTEALR